MSKKYYWLKLDRNFFKRHDIKVIESMDNGKDYILWYLKMLVESIDHDGELRFSETIPYNEKMLSVVTDTNIDIVRSAIKLFTELGMIEILDDKTVYMAQVQTMIGGETDAAERMRKHRDRKQITENVTPLQDVTNSYTEIEKELDKDKEKKKLPPPKCKFAEAVYMTKVQYETLEKKYGKDDTDKMVETLSLAKLSKGYKYKSDYHAILKWVVDAVGAAEKKVVENVTCKKCGAEWPKTAPRCFDCGGKL